MKKVCVFFLPGLLVVWLMLASGNPFSLPPQTTLPPSAASADVEPDSRMYGLRLVEQADTEAVWEVDVGEVAWYATAQHAVVRRVRARFFQAELPPISLEAEYGHVAQASGNMSVSGHVRLQHPAGYTVTTDSLHWRVTDRVLYTDAPVQIVSPTMRIRGVGFRSEIAQRQFELQQNVRASLRLD